MSDDLSFAYYFGMVIYFFLGVVCYMKLDKENRKLPSELQTFNTVKRILYAFCCFFFPGLCCGLVSCFFYVEIQNRQKIFEQGDSPPPIQTTQHYPQSQKNEIPIVEATPVYSNNQLNLS